MPLSKQSSLKFRKKQKQIKRGKTSIRIKDSGKNQDTVNLEEDKIE